MMFTGSAERGDGEGAAGTRAQKANPLKYIKSGPGGGGGGSFGKIKKGQHDPARCRQHKKNIKN